MDRVGQDCGRVCLDCGVGVVYFPEYTDSARDAAAAKNCWREREEMTNKSMKALSRDPSTYTHDELDTHSGGKAIVKDEEVHPKTDAL